ncbi:HlyD family secretion protein [Legionella oakridgensis]|uniref:Multidrug resistance efflux pump n=2 Tax=Legionella oakridgensis TaxID=29423 RepID=W0BBR4_9GAMM|nr:HlyD family efflux transporter periplasmic adaptor subunit [Legionella oakridgensis]AHE67973.1 multidrug resistance efflux pump [Legionella oakridgensis ATCC 33761 = DSM 21215]ETO92602.1 multidrug resistance efflux pump [Legionella oakridgensis RV-2-2007]KTD38787.1 hemolysin D [Legionella oakridgensis]STY20971.1 hemolysin D [Legionella longbeachae]
MNVRTIASLIGMVCLVGCGQSDHDQYQGYVEGEAIYLASPYSGVLVKKVVERGQQVKKDELLFKLDENPEILIIKERQSEIAQAQKIYKDLQNPKRIPEIAAIHAKISQVDSQLQLAELRVNRYRTLYEKDATDKDNYDEALARFKELEHLKAQYQSDLELALLGSREEQLNAQKAKISALNAQLNQAQWRLAQKRVVAPENGVILDTYYQQGEFVGSQKAVMSLLAPRHMRIEFFVPVKQLAKLHLGQVISFTCDGCDKKNKAVINYISPEAEFIPPLVYSRENSDKLVFRVKASIEKPNQFKPGQPVIVYGIESGS